MTSDLTEQQRDEHVCCLKRRLCTEDHYHERDVARMIADAEQRGADRVTAAVGAALDDDAVYDRVENAVMKAMLAHGHGDGCWPAVTADALDSLRAALSDPDAEQRGYDRSPFAP